MTKVRVSHQHSTVWVFFSFHLYMGPTICLDAAVRRSTTRPIAASRYIPLRLNCMHRCGLCRRSDQCMVTKPCKHGSLSPFSIMYVPLKEPFPLVPHTRSHSQAHKASAAGATRRSPCCFLVSQHEASPISYRSDFKADPIPYFAAIRSLM